MGKVQNFPVKSKKVKAQDLKLHYYYIIYKEFFSSNKEMILLFGKNYMIFQKKFLRI
jgi:hypothetical protein